MAESSYSYETEIEWQGENDFRLGGRKLPDITAGAPPEFNGPRRRLEPGVSFRGVIK